MLGNPPIRDTIIHHRAVGNIRHYSPTIRLHRLGLVPRPKPHFILPAHSMSNPSQFRRRWRLHLLLRHRRPSL
ncbi:hypothetical protein KSP39_PZI023182 [Platanthera zijinensis]|uniref:Uncharacterized protein n=1 Tax=Platanthera zijinensis TaxID=2320716 RepID=A0AAP0AVJ6_9ASPA